MVPHPARRLLVASLCLAVVPTLAPAHGLEPVAIVSPDRASPLETLAAREVRRYVYLRTGRLLPIEPEARLTFYLDDTAESWEDPWLTAWLALFENAPPASALGSIRALNPWITDTIQALIPNNVAAIHVFRSCDGGFTYSVEPDCKRDPAADGKFAEVGWYPWLTLEPDDRGDFSNTFVKNS